MGRTQSVRGGVTGALLWAALVTTMGCHLLPVTPRPKEGATCTEACENLRRRGCKEGEPNKDGTSCEQVCTYYSEKGLLDTGCLAGVQVCEQADSCSK